MKKSKDIVWFPSQLALILGENQMDILDWVNRGLLAAERSGRVTKIKENDLVHFLREYPEHVGRVYCSDLDSRVINEARVRIVRKLEV